MCDHPTFILASSSPRRRELLKMIGMVPDAIEPADIDETPYKGELPKLHALRLAVEKARKMAREDAVVLASDTVVGCGRRILPKAENPQMVRDCLKLLSGRRHQVHTGVCVIDAHGREQSLVVSTRVKCRLLEKWEIDAYVASGEGEGKAGGYAIQGMASAFIPWINGSYHAVMGLPLAETARLLVSAGLKPFNLP
jgi:septum formation protein